MKQPLAWIPPTYALIPGGCSDFLTESFSVLWGIILGHTLSIYMTIAIGNYLGTWLIIIGAKPKGKHVGQV